MTLLDVAKNAPVMSRQRSPVPDEDVDLVMGVINGVVTIAQARKALVAAGRPTNASTWARNTLWRAVRNQMIEVRRL